MQLRALLITVLAAAAPAAAQTPTLIDRLGRTAGRLHPIAVHFPIALIVTACLIELTRAVRRKGEVSPAALVCLCIGALAACIAALFGWLNASFENVVSDTAELHRWLGIALAGLAVILAASGLTIRTGTVGVRAYRLGLVIAAGLAGYGGHLGGILTHGETYISDALRDLVSPRPPVIVQPGEPAPTSLTAIRFPADGKIDFKRDVRPIFALACIECHGESKRKGALRLDVKAAAMAGGKKGSLLVAGKPDESQLIERVMGEGDEQRMPLDRDPLPEECIRILRAWVEQGAQWPDDGLSMDHGKEDVHWAYIKPVSHQPPPIKDPWARNPIDNFIAAKLKSRKLSHSPDADAATLIRRVTLDLTGLPPTVEEVDAFIADTRPDAYERVVDRLLASPRYGEHMARGWLDLARYADSSGYEKDGGRSIWPYRDWVIQALNADMPFDQFTNEQLAGDLLASPTEAQLIATGFNRNSMINEEGGVDPEEYRVNAVIDRANTTATVWLGATLACAQCHDHKFDPYTQEDYYRFFAFFNESPEESRLAAGSEFQEISPKLTLKDGHEPARDKIRELEAAFKAAPKDSPEAADSKKNLDELRSSTPAAITTLVMRSEPTPRESHILKRGSFLNPGEPVEPGVPAALGSIPATPRANRESLAHWLTAPENPLTARVQANRLWEHHFGRGLVETSEDFGTRGSPPSHPELLDFLATELIRQKWSLKGMHRLIVTSATYRQSSRVTPSVLDTDPLNIYLARGPRPRLDAETIHDQALAIGGLLSTKMGGPPVFPVQPDGIWSNPYSDNKWNTSKGEDLHRRSIYTFWKRSSPYPSLVAFDAPNRQVTCTRRPRTNTPLQALTTLNDPVYIEAAAALAKRILTLSDERPETRIDFAVKACLARTPDAAERARLLALYKEQLDAFSKDTDAANKLASDAKPDSTSANRAELAAWTVIANVLLNLDELLTRG